MSKIPVFASKRLPEKTLMLTSESAPPPIVQRKIAKVICTKRRSILTKRVGKENLKTIVRPSVPKKIIAAAYTVKIPSYDFKARFNRLKEIHLSAKANYDEMTKEYDGMKSKYEEMEVRSRENEKLKKDILNYTSQLQEFVVIEQQNVKLRRKLEDTTTELDEMKKMY